MNLPGETKAGNAAMQPMPRGKPGGLIETMNGAQRLPFCAPQEDHIGSEDPDALKIAARRAEYSLTESALSPFQAEPTQSWFISFSPFVLRVSGRLALPPRMAYS
jgi:hypothetical protein